MVLRLTAGFAVVATALVLACGGPLSAGEQDGTGLIAGRVIDADDGTPIQDAVVALLRGSSIGSPVVDRVRTDDVGSFVFRNVGAGSWTLSAGKPGYQGTSAANRPAFVTLSSGEKSTNSLLRLRRFGWIEGTVEDEAGNPAAGVPVRLAVRASHGRWRLGTTVRADDRGVFRFSSLRAAEYRVFAAFTVASVDSKANGVPALRVNGADLALEAVAGALNIDPDGRPLLYPVTFAPGTTDFGSAESIVLRATGRSGVRIRLEPVHCRKVQGRSEVASSEVPEQLSVRLLRADTMAIQPDIQVASTEVDVDGGFVFPCVAPGRYVIRVLRTPTAAARDVPSGEIGSEVETRSLGARPQRQTATTLWGETAVSVGAQDIAGLRLDVRVGAVVSGRIVLESATAKTVPERFATIPVQFVPADGRPPAFLPARPAGDLSFKTPPMPPGEYILFYSPLAPWSVRTATLQGRDIADQSFLVTAEAIPDVVITLTDRAATLAGVVRDRAGVARPGTPVLLFATDSRFWLPVSRRVRATRSTSTGSFSFAGVPDGDYFLIAPEQEPEDTWSDPSLLTRLARLATRVAVREGQAASAGLVIVPVPRWRSVGVADFSSERHTSEVGPFVDDSMESRSEVGVDQVGIDLLGEVVTETDVLVRGAVVSLATAAGGFQHATMTDVNGRFVFRQLPAGAYRLKVSKAGFLDTEYGARGPGRPGLSLVLRPSEGFRVKVVMTRAAAITGVVRSESGEPLAGATVQALIRVSTTQADGLVAAPGAVKEAQADEGGGYRLYGLAPGAYVVGVTLVNTTAGTPARPTSDTALQPQQFGAGRPAIHRREVVYAPAFYPGVRGLGQAEVLQLQAGEERAGVDITLRLTETFKVTGTVRDQAGRPTGSARVTLVPAGPYIPASHFIGPVGSGEAGSRGGMVTITTSAAGTFAIDALTPGGYVLVVRHGTDEASLWAKAVVDIRDADTVVSVTLQASRQMRGRAVFDSGAKPAPERAGWVKLAGVEGGVTVNPPPAAVEDGRFVVRNLLPGRYRLSVTDSGTSWFLVGAQLDGQDVLEGDVSVPEVGDIGELLLSFTDRPTELGGSLTDVSGQPATDYHIVVFAADRRFWTEGSRRVAATRPKSDGSFSVVNLPAGAYRVAAVTDVAPDEWFNPSFLAGLEAGSHPVELKAGQRTTQDFRIAAR